MWVTGFGPRADFERFVQARVDSGVETLKALGLDWASWIVLMRNPIGERYVACQV